MVDVHCFVLYTGSGCALRMYNERPVLVGGVRCYTDSTYRIAEIMDASESEIA